MKFDGFDWDAGNSAKCCKHGVSQAEIEFVLETTDLISDDANHSVVEQRFIAVGADRNDRMMFVAFTMREVDGLKLLRPVSARYMHQKEWRRYVEKARD